MILLGKEIEKLLFDKDRKVYNLYSEKGELIFVIPDTVMSTLINDEMLMEIEFKLNEEDIKNRALERIAKLRNLNSPIIMSDPLTEFETVPVFIFLPGKEINIFEAEKLTNSCGDFMEALDFELETENEPIMGSYIQKLWFKIKKGSKATREEVAQDFAKGKKALELKYVELPTAEQTEKLANSAAKIVELLEGQQEGIVRLGALIVLKKQVDGNPHIFIQQLNFELISLFDKTPQLLYNLQTTYEILTGDVKGVKHLDESGTEQLSQ